jgi:hypothetical protein
MKYIRVNWHHSDPTDPIVLYSELDDNNWEVRKVEVFDDGHSGCASATESGGNTRLSIEPIPPLEEIANDPQFEPREISPVEFEELWTRRKNV